MTREQAEKHKEVIQHFINGGEIQYWSIGAEEWLDVENPSWCIYYQYRIKPKSEYIPFDFSDAERLIGKCIKSKDKSLFLVIGVIGEGFVMSFNGISYSHSELFDRFTFLDGTPCGKLKQ